MKTKNQRRKNEQKREKNVIFNAGRHRIKIDILIYRNIYAIKVL